MTHLDDVEIGRRLRSLRVDPPETGFEARLAERLLAVESETRAPAGHGQVIRGPWLRRGPVRLIGVTALLMAGAAAAMEGRVVEWVQARVLQRVDDAPAPSAPAEPAPRGAHGERSARVEVEASPQTDTALAAPELAPSIAVPALSLTPPAAEASTAARAVPRLEPERSARHAGLGLERSRTLEAPRSDESIRVPRVAMERRSGARDALDERRADRRLPEAEPRDTEHRLERLRDVARQRRERSGGERIAGERAAALERLREHRDRLNERRDGAQEREHERRERGGR